MLRGGYHASYVRGAGAVQGITRSATWDFACTPVECACGSHTLIALDRSRTPASYAAQCARDLSRFNLGDAAARETHYTVTTLAWRVPCARAKWYCM